MKQKKNVTKILIAGLVLIAIIAVMALVYHQFAPQGANGSKKITVEVIVPDKPSKEFTIQTNAKFLGKALDEKKLIKGTPGKYGLFITSVNGVTADSSKDEWWCITKSGKQVNTGADTTPVKNGDHFELTLKIGFGK